MYLSQALVKVMTEYNLQKKKRIVSSNEMVKLVEHELPSILEDKLDNHELYHIKGSCGMGGWASVPWVCLMDKDITDSTKKGIYVGYLFSENMEHVYLTLMTGVTEFTNRLRDKIGHEVIENQVQYNRKFIKSLSDNIEKFNIEESFFFTPKA